MKETLNKKIVNYAVLLTLFCAITSAGLAFVYKITTPKIYKHKKLTIISSRKEVLNLAKNFKEKNGYVEGYNVQGQSVGKVIKIITKGYGGSIEILVGINLDNKIVGVKILNHNETPGLGNKIEQKPFLKQLLNKTATEVKLKKDGGKIDAITGATISSQAVIDAIRKSLDRKN